MKKTIMITGASSGIGKATAYYFNARGWNVVATMRNPDKEIDLTQLEDVLVTKLDVTDKESIQSALEATITKFGQIDVLLNNAGYGATGILEAFDIEGIEKQFSTNVLGLIGVTKGVLPIMRQQKSGVILNVSSVGGKVAYPLGSLYHGTKFAVEGFSEGLYYEAAAIGVQVKIIEPGAIATNFGSRSIDFRMDEALTEYKDLSESFKQAFGAVMDAASKPEDVAAVIYQAATDGKDQLRYIAGSDAEETLGARKQLDDQTLMAGIKTQLNL